MTAFNSTHRVSKELRQSSAVSDHLLGQRLGISQLRVSKDDANLSPMHQAVDTTEQLHRIQPFSRKWKTPAKHISLGLLSLLSILVVVSLFPKFRGTLLKPPKAPEQLTEIVKAGPQIPQQLTKPYRVPLETAKQPTKSRDDPLLQLEEKPRASPEHPSGKLDVTPETAEPLVVARPQEKPRKALPPAEEKAIKRAKVAEKNVDAILKEARSIVDTIPINSVERSYFEEALRTIHELKRSHSMLLMDDDTLADFNLQVSALKATCLYQRASMHVKANIMELRRHLEDIFRSPKKLDKIIAAHIGVSLRAVKMGEFLDRQPLTAQQKKYFFVDEVKTYKSEDKKRERKLTALLTPFIFKMREVSTRKELDMRAVQLERAGNVLRAAAAEARNLMDEALKKFPVNKLSRLHAFTMFRDLLQTLPEISSHEIGIWTRIARGEKPLATPDIYKYHDSVSLANISYDSCVRFPLQSLLPRDLLGLLHPRPSLLSNELKAFEVLQQDFIKWGDCLMGIQIREATMEKPASIRRFDFSGLMWRTFAVTWILRDEEQRGLITRTNQGILERNDKPLAFDEAMKCVHDFKRLSLEIVPEGWHDLPEKSKVHTDKN